MARDRKSDGGTGNLTGKGLDTLLAAAETLPHAAEDGWRLDLFKVALRIARSTESTVDLDRANLAFRTLPPRLRNPLIDRAAALARREAERAASAADQEQEAPRGPGLLGGLFRRSAGPASRRTARERLLRELTTRRDPDDDRET
ncbi:hypothetical protein [Azospirillum picis]|uniref:Uncharacterized protein n=1 Tax=Azospirillum picis TaxID=488438 RepID=A0ABU0MUD6_9PROT|nr:hypothetical protein [Azospirillum picis]MBP2299149.1 hypothetical protein [Azospirillum picis]MDQ0537075.1 hypothetical protein [Azospirillum picis]